MSWYGDDLVKNSKWVLDKFKIVISGVVAAATAARTAATSGAAAQSTAAAAAAEAQEAAMAAEAALTEAMATVGATSEMVAAAEAAAAASAAASAGAGAAAATAATAAAIAEALAVLAACISALLAGMAIGQGIGLAGDKIVEGVGWLWGKVFGSASGTVKVGSRSDATRATDHCLAAMHEKYFAGSGLDREAYFAAYRQSDLGARAYAFAASNVQTLMHLAQACSMLRSGDTEGVAACSEVIQLDCAMQAQSYQDMSDALRALAPKWLAKASLPAGASMSMIAAARKAGARALPPDEVPLVRIVFEEAGVRPSDDVGGAFAEMLAAMGPIDRAKDKAVTLPDYLASSRHAWMQFARTPWAAALAATSMTRGEAAARRSPSRRRGSSNKS